MEEMKRINLEWIKARIIDLWMGTTEDMLRDLIITKSLSNYGNVGYYFMALNGSPPRGCAIYHPKSKLLVINCYDKTKVYPDVCIDEIEAGMFSRLSMRYQVHPNKYNNPSEDDVPLSKLTEI